jgi:hypothetical protein
LENNKKAAYFLPLFFFVVDFKSFFHAAFACPRYVILVQEGIQNTDGMSHGQETHAGRQTA